jgi:hypothetical protein
MEAWDGAGFIRKFNVVAEIPGGRKCWETAVSALMKSDG